jgi:hypothetical protein
MPCARRTAPKFHGLAVIANYRAIGGANIGGGRQEFEDYAVYDKKRSS